MRRARRRPGSAVLSVLGRRAPPDASADARPVRGGGAARTTALAAAEAGGNWNGITASRVQLAWCWKDVGRGAEQVAEVERFVQEEVLTRPQSGGATAMWNGNLALFMAEAGLRARAQEYLDRVAAFDDKQLRGDVDGAALPRSPAKRARYWRRTARTALLRTAPTARRPLHPRRPRRLLPWRGGTLPGLLAATLGRSDDDSASRGRAGDEHARASAALDRPQLLELARALLTRGRAGDDDRAADLLGRAELLASELGMRSLAAQVAFERSAPTESIPSARRVTVSTRSVGCSGHMGSRAREPRPAMISSASATVRAISAAHVGTRRTGCGGGRIGTRLTSGRHRRAAGRSA